MGLEYRCIICYNDDEEYWGITQCNHVCCLKCTLRYKFILNKPGCPICSFEIEGDELLFKVIKEPEKTKFSFTSDEYLWANCIVCQIEDVSVIEGILSRSCQLCKTEFYDQETLISHYQKKHQRKLCPLCVQHRCELPCDYMIYDEIGLSKHYTGKDPGDGHPLCGFCKERFYTQEMLTKHCRKQHELCYLCERLGKKNEYYKNYYELEKHFSKTHYVCNERMCKDAKCYAFIDEVELAAHRASLHPVRKEEKIKLAVPKRDPQEKREKQEKRPSSQPIPEYLDREPVIQRRALKEKYHSLIRREFSNSENLITWTDEYSEETLMLSDYVKKVREVLGDNLTIEFVLRIRTYLGDKKLEEINRDFPAIRRSIEFAPFVPIKKPEPAPSPKAKEQRKDKPVAWGKSLTRNAWNEAIKGSKK
ncbi:E3 ubiquitin-protein ligase [Nematocida sp. LUAm3]|nr:E3 ubiquitin-protein ligase [Nematocida sp. LUAm3]KAI5174942.1 E3 ubiquitin-protein ligase [Nematocida sp. LUAm2]KAI5177459.1 E3 ubiquitin-protein ligase [Nematocida sp. LUAm1]